MRVAWNSVETLRLPPCRTDCFNPMKTTVAALLALLLIAPVQAEIFRPGGGRSAPVDAPRGSSRGEHRPAPSPRWRDGHQHRGGGVVGFGHGYFGPGYGYAYYPGYAYGYYPGYGADYPYYGVHAEPSAASSGMLIGAIAGGIIGNNSGAFGHSGWRGAAWGAGAGLLLGSVVDAERAREVQVRAPVPTVVYAPAPAAAAAPAASVPHQVTIINNYYGASPMSSANSLFGR